MTVIRHPKDFWAGVLFIALGGLGFLIALDYSMGTAGRMGPGYFPRALGLLLAALGVVLVLRAVRVQGEAIAFPTFRPVLIVLASVFVFGITVTWAGLVIAVVLLVFVASTASHEFRWKEALVAAAVLAAFCVVAFQYGLQLQLPVWPPALVG